MNIHTFTEQIAEYQERLLKIATENNFAILLMTSVGEHGSGGTNTVGATNMEKGGIAAANLYQSAYAQRLYDEQ